MRFFRVPWDCVLRASVSLAEERVYWQFLFLLGPKGLSSSLSVLLHYRQCYQIFLGGVKDGHLTVMSWKGASSSGVQSLIPYLVMLFGSWVSFPPGMPGSKLAGGGLTDHLLWCILCSLPCFADSALKYRRGAGWSGVGVPSSLRPCVTEWAGFVLAMLRAWVPVRGSCLVFWGLICLLLFCLFSLVFYSFMDLLAKDLFHSQVKSF